MGDVYLIGRDSDTWSNPDMRDLVALRGSHVDDPCTKWITDRAVRWWHRIAGKYLRVRHILRLVDPSGTQHSGSIAARGYRILSKYRPLLRYKSIAHHISDRLNPRIYVPDSLHHRLILHQIRLGQIVYHWNLHHCLFSEFEVGHECEIGGYFRCDGCVSKFWIGWRRCMG